MPSRLLALSLAVVAAVVGVLPSLVRYRCVRSGGQAAMARACCRGELAEPRLTRPCCERLAAPALEARATSERPASGAAPTVALQPRLVPSRAVGPTAAFAAERRAVGPPHGQDPHLLSPVLIV
jgi:hypothetical protein